MKDLVDILQEFGEIAHWTMRPAPEACGGNLSYPPIITWRYKQPTTEVAEFFARVVSAYRGAVSWEFSGTDRTWSLMPSRVKDYAKANGDIGGLAAAAELTDKEPEFGQRANAELPLLVAHIQKHLSPLSL